jgi:hypothetical protein
MFWSRAERAEGVCHERVELVRAGHAEVVDERAQPSPQFDGWLAEHDGPTRFAVCRVQSQPASAAMRSASTRLRASSLIIADAR